MPSLPPPSADADFIVTCYEIFLGRELDSLEVVRDRGGWPRMEVVRSIVGSPEFAHDVLPALESGLPFPVGRFRGRPSLRQRLWTAEALGLEPAASERAKSADSWRDLLLSLKDNPNFASTAHWPDI